MGLYNKYGEYNAKAEAARREVLVKKFLDSDETHLLILDETNENPGENKNDDWPSIETTDTPTFSTVKITKTFGSGSSYSADCPNCGKTKILSSELNTMTAVCSKCYTPFKLEK